VTFTATVTASGGGAGTPTGTLTFKDGTATLGTGAINSSGKSTMAINTLSVATHSITAVYSGDANFTGNTSPTLTEAVNKGTVAVSITSSANPSKFGKSVTFTASVTPNLFGSYVPTGTIVFKDGITTLGTATLNSSGIATLATNSLSVATHSITAVYGGDANIAASISLTLNQTVSNH
jgi:hypothetical protein